MRHKTLCPPRHAGPNVASVYACIGLYFSLTAGVLSDFAVSWDQTEIIYEAATIAGLLVSALLMRRYKRMAVPIALGGAAVAFGASLIMEGTGILLGPFILLRLGMAPMICYVFWIASVVIDQNNHFVPLSLSVLLAYSTAAVVEHTQIILLHFGAASAFFVALGTAFLAFSKELTDDQAPPATPVPTALRMRLKPASIPKPAMGLLLILLVMGQLFNSFDVVLMNQIKQGSGAGSMGTTHAVLLLLIGLGYLWGGIVARKSGIHTLFIASCALTQVFLLIALIPDQAPLMQSALPLYVIGSAGIDLSVILSPRLFWCANLNPIHAVSGFVVFRILKLYLIPWLFPEHWKIMPLSRLVIVLTILLALGQMLVLFGFLTRRKGMRLETKAEPPKAYIMPSLPDTMTPREKEVALLLLEGKDRNAIAASMHISFSTVNKHCVSIYRKTGCASHVELLIKFGRAAEAPQHGGQAPPV